MTSYGESKIKARQQRMLGMVTSDWNWSLRALRDNSRELRANSRELIENFNKQKMLPTTTLKSQASTSRPRNNALFNNKPIFLFFLFQYPQCNLAVLFSSFCYGYVLLSWKLPKYFFILILFYFLIVPTTILLPSLLYFVNNTYSNFHTLCRTWHNI